MLERYNEQDRDIFLAELIEGSGVQCRADVSQAGISPRPGVGPWGYGIRSAGRF